MMSTPVQSIQMHNLNELRSILEQMSAQNLASVQAQLIHHLEDEHQTVRRLSGVCYEQLGKKEQNLQNVIRFALHVLNELQAKIEQNNTTQNQVQRLQNDFNKLLNYNSQLLTKVEDIQDQNSHFMQKIQQAETYISEVSNSANREAKMDSLMTIQIHSIGISNFSQKYTHLTQRPPIISTDNNFVSKQQHTRKLTILEQSVQSKSEHIHQLQRQISCLNSKINCLNSKVRMLQNDFQLKSSQLQLSQLYFRQKIDIINEGVVNKSKQPHCVISEHQINSVFRRQMSRVSSVQSIDSNILNSQNNQQCQFDNDQISRIDQLNRNGRQKYERSQFVRRSLMQEFVSDLLMESKDSLFGSSDNSKGQRSYNTMNKCSDSKISLNSLTANMKITSTKGTQTNFHSHKSKLLTRHNAGPKKTYKQKKTLNQTSFFGSFSTLTSLFTKKPTQSAQECTHPRNILATSFLHQLNKQTQFVLPPASSYQQQPSTTTSTITDLFKGIYQYATKKIVTDRIHHKKRNGNSLLNQSVILDDKKDSKLAKKGSCFKKRTYL